MTQNAIIAKLNATMQEPVDSECKVVYALCEIRKLLKDIPTARRPFALNMHCHWALHVDLHGRDTVAPFLRQVDAYVNGVLVGPEDLNASHQMVRDFVVLDTFRTQLRDFLQAVGIPTDLVDDDAAWNEFVAQYAGVIEDGALAIRSENHGLEHVKQVTFTKGREALGEFSQLPFDMMWTIALLDGRSLEVEVNGAGQMLGGRLRVHDAEVGPETHALRSQG